MNPMFSWVNDNVSLRKCSGDLDAQRHQQGGIYVNKSSNSSKTYTRTLSFLLYPLKLVFIGMFAKPPLRAGKMLESVLSLQKRENL